jgi:hypothetical protein
MKPWMDIGLEWATKYYQCMDNICAYIIAMCVLSLHPCIMTALGVINNSVVDPAIYMLWIKAYWDDEYIASAEKTVLEMVCH